jgi:hypothetical protein
VLNRNIAEVGFWLSRIRRAGCVVPKKRLKQPLCLISKNYSLLEKTWRWKLALRLLTAR